MKKLSQKLLFIDVETTGVNPERNGIIQVSGCVQIENELLESFDYYVRPFPQDIVEPSALEVTGINPKQLLSPDHPDHLYVPGQKFLEPSEVYLLLQAIFKKYVDQYDKTDKFHFVGYNAHSFDMPFMRRFWEKNKDKFFGSWFWYPCLDVMLVWAQILQKDRDKLPNFKLATVAKHIGISVDESRLHDSEYDIELTRKLWLNAFEITHPNPSPEDIWTQGELF